MTVTLHLGDCLDIMRTMPAGSVDAVITDPPYGIGKENIVPFKRTDRNSKGRNSSADDFRWDESRKDEEIKKLIEFCPNAVIFGGNYYADVLPPSPGWIVWDKDNSGNFSNFELAWTSYKRAARMYRYMWNGMIKQRPEERYHPTQKPVSLMVWILENYTNPGDTVFDPFMGSGTTGVACVKTGRNFIGIEIDKSYFEIAKKRIKEAEMQLSLFDHNPSDPRYEHDDN